MWLQVSEMTPPSRMQGLVGPKAVGRRLVVRTGLAMPLHGRRCTLACPSEFLLPKLAPAPPKFSCWVSSL